MYLSGSGQSSKRGKELAVTIRWLLRGCLRLGFMSYHILSCPVLSCPVLSSPWR